MVLFILLKISMDKIDEILHMEELKINYQRNECKYFSYIETNKK